MASSSAASSASICASGGMAASNRLHGPRIVEPETILDDEQLKMEEKSKTNIAEDFRDKESALQFLARRRVIENEIECKICESQATIVRLPLQTVESDGYVWECTGCARIRTMRSGTNLLKVQASLQDILLGLLSIFDLKETAPLEKKVPNAASSYIIATTEEILDKSLSLGGENVVYFDVIRMHGSVPPICVAIENTTNLTVVDTAMSTVLDKSSRPGSKIVHTQSHLCAIPAAMKCSKCHYINVADQTQTDSAHYKEEHRKAIASFREDLKTMNGKLNALIKRRIPYVDSAKALCLKRYFAHSHIENPLAYFFSLKIE